MGVPRIDLRREFRSAAARADPAPVYARLRRLGPVLRSRDLLGDGFVITWHEDVSRLIRDPRFANDRGNVPGGRSLDRWWAPSMMKLMVSSMVFKDPPDHRRLRNLVQKAFTPARVADLQTRVAEIAGDLLDAAATKPVIDLMADFALPLPLAVIAEMLGVPRAERDRFRTLFARTQSNQEMNPLSFVRSYPHMLRLNGFLRELVRRRRVAPGDDLISALVAADEAGDRLGEDELIAMVFLLLFAGHETTVNLIGNGVLELVRHPEQMQRLRDDPDLIDPAIEEMLRFTNPVGFVALRYATEDVEIAGVPLPRGSMVTPLIASANLDESAFEHADTFDVTRSPNRHLSFGAGGHFCLGAPLARLEARIAVPALLARFHRLELAAPVESLPWRPHIALRGVDALPLSVGVAPAAAQSLPS